MAQIDESVPLVIGEEEPTEFQESQDRDEKDFWRNVAKERKRGQIDRTLDGLKQIINLNGVVLGVYFAALSISSLSKYLIIYSPSDAVWILVILGPAIAWFFSLFFSIRALCSTPSFPHWTNDASIIKISWKKDFKSLSKALQLSRWSLLAGFGFMILNIAVYIYVSCDP